MIDLDSLADEEDETLKPLDEKSVVHIIAHTAKAYGNQFDEWFDLAVNYFDEKEDAAGCQLQS